MFLALHRRVPRVFCASIALACVLCIGHGLALAAPKARPLTAQERQQLDRGELVTRPEIERRGALRLVGGTSWQVINAKPSAVWQAVLDTSRYHRMLPRVKYAKLAQKNATQRTVFVMHSAGVIDASYYLKVKTYPERWDVTFTLDDSRPHSIRAAWGYYSVRPYANGKTLLAYGAMVDVGDGLFAGMTRTTVQDWALKVPWMIKRFVEGSGRWIYR
jgi:hypothetical protein